jgi:hypothetical protein
VRNLLEVTSRTLLSAVSSFENPLQHTYRRRRSETSILRNRKVPPSGDKTVWGT